jgi:hypothetical protein
VVAAVADPNPNPDPDPDLEHRTSDPPLRNDASPK